MARSYRGSRSTYDPAADKIFWELADAGLSVGLVSYAGGPAKFALQRPDSNFKKLGRLSLEEAKTIHRLLGEAMERFEKEQAGMAAGLAAALKDKEEREAQEARKRLAAEAVGPSTAREEAKKKERILASIGSCRG